MGARARGASIPDLELRLERVARRLPNHRSASLWSKYASLGPSEARYVMERHPDLLLAVGPEALEQDPERVIPLLLDEVRAGEELPAADSLSAKPLGILTRWLTGPPRGGQDLLYRRSSLLRGADRWRRQGGDPNAAIRAMCIALAPRSDYATADPGAGRTITVHYDLLLQHHVESLKKLWPMVSQAVGETDRAPWTDLVGLAFGWLTPWAPPHGHVPDEIRTAMRSFAERMLRDLADVSRRHPGVQHQLRVTGERVGLNIAVTLDPEFEALHQELESGRSGQDDESWSTGQRCGGMGTPATPGNDTDTYMDRIRGASRRYPLPALVAVPVCGTCQACSRARRRSGGVLGPQTPSRSRRAVHPPGSHDESTTMAGAR